MTSLLLRTLHCEGKKSSSIARPSRRPISIRSAINKSLRAAKDEDQTKRGGRDRSKFVAPRTLGAFPRSDVRVGQNYARPRRREDGFVTQSRFERVAYQNPRQDRQYKEPRHQQDFSDPGRQRGPFQKTQTGHQKTVYSFPIDPVDPRKVAKEASSAGLLRNIKSACNLVQSLRRLEVTGKDLSNITEAIESVLANINNFIETGNFEEDSAEAIASLFRKKAADDTFFRYQLDDRRRSAILQSSDGKLELVGGHGPFDEPEHSPEVDEDPSKMKLFSTSRAVEGSPRSEASNRRPRDDREEELSIPVSIPYTTAASQFLYGYNSVLAALRAQQRKLYKLYVHPKIFERESGAKSGQNKKRSSPNRPANEFIALARETNTPFQNEFRTALLDQMSEGRPHNGVILEASKLPAPPVVSLGPATEGKSIIPLNLARQTKEEADINGMHSSINTVAKTKSWRYPLVVLLDGITDPGNVGNIIRTCHFYGVDAVAIATNTCANISSAVLAKASSGACEAMKLLAIPQPSNFVMESRRSKWKVYAAVPSAAGVGHPSQHLTTADVAARSPLAKNPCILILGSEGEGLRENLIKRSEYFVSIKQGEKPANVVDVGVDSMNVGVAAGVLLESFMREPNEGTPPEEHQSRRVSAQKQAATPRA